MNTKKEVKFTGKEYLAYTQYEDSKKIKWTPENKKILFCISSIGIISIFLTIMVKMTLDKLYPVVYTPVVYTWSGIYMFLAVCAGLAWVTHGFGFLLVRR